MREIAPSPGGLVAANLSRAPELLEELVAIASTKCQALAALKHKPVFAAKRCLDMPVMIDGFVNTAGMVVRRC